MIALGRLRSDGVDVDLEIAVWATECAPDKTKEPNGFILRNVPFSFLDCAWKRPSS